MGHDTGSRHRLFALAREHAEWSGRQAWLGYFALGGTCDLFDLEAFLAGLGAFAEHEQDVLAVALNDRLRDLYLARCVPLLLTEPVVLSTGPDPVQVLAELTAEGQQHPAR